MISRAEFLELLHDKRDDTFILWDHGAYIGSAAVNYIEHKARINCISEIIDMTSKTNLFLISEKTSYIRVANWLLGNKYECCKCEDPLESKRWRAIFDEVINDLYQKEHEEERKRAEAEKEEFSQVISNSKRISNLEIQIDKLIEHIFEEKK